MITTQTTNEILMMLPLISITFFSIIAIVLDPLSGKYKTPIYWFTCTGLITTALLSAYTLSQNDEKVFQIIQENSITKMMINYGGYAAFVDILFCLAGLMTLFATKQYLSKENSDYKEFYSLLLLSISGMMLIAHSANLLILFIGIEIMSVSFYVMSGFFRTNTRSVEAALKYFLLGAFATGFLVYGIAMIYGATGTLNINEIHLNITSLKSHSIYLTIGIGLLIIGLSFKIAVFPFHQWAPDVYEGAPTVVTGFMSTAGKSAAIIGLIIIAKGLFPLNEFQSLSELSSSSSIAINNNFHSITNNAQFILSLIAAATMLYGNIVALVQKNIKRMLAYSSIAHAGYLLMGVVSNNTYGWGGILFYLTAYLFMQIGAFVVVSIIEKDKEQNLNITDYSGLHKSKPFLAAMMALFMLSLAGIPPMAGFFGKYYLFLAAINAGFTWLTIVAVISSIISVYFYIGLIVNMYFKDAIGDGISTKTGLANISLIISTAFILILGIFPSYLLELTIKLFS